MFAWRIAAVGDFPGSGYIKHLKGFCDQFK